MNHKEPFFCSCIGCHTRILSIFKNLTPEEIENIDANKKCQLFKKGEYLYKENSYPTGHYCISSGKVKLSTLGENGREHILKIVGEGDITGENAIFSKHPHHHSAIAIEDTMTCFVPKEAFMKSLRNSPAMTMDVLEALSKNIETAERKQQDFAQKNVKERLADTLLSFKNSYGENDEHFLNIKFSREEIADFIGTSTETVIRLLSEWNSASIITLNKKQIRINSVDKLTLISQPK
ncbi:MAG: Crp/Fnr family transcriptional regulator [Pseudopedobacter saltans]|uniref:Crp/Fnr family transcriptional regulator n=1 Tax=Pseudopedobacter saltans TaxID=151895 RepID=A0A2W5ERB7_9SPHI|nr:MAG: Crp/Fnr family transcriptional regulator [Pseudopedobacter saltans]